MLLDSIQKERVVAIFRGLSLDQLERRVELLVENDLTIMEITLNSPGALHTIEKLKHKYGQDIQIGAGTVLSTSEVEDVKNAGGEFIISPNMNVDVIRETKEQGLLSIPGVFSPSEIQSAVEAGADMLKVFPATTLSPDYVKHLKGPFPNYDFIATGGIGSHNAAEYIESGYAGVGIGSSLTSQQDEEKLLRDLKIYKELSMKN